MITINEERLWQRLMIMAQIGGTPKGGVCRLPLTDEDKESRDLFVQWCEDAGCEVTVDQMGNIFGRRAGTQNELPPVLMGSHLDSQPTGGKFDGVYGVLAGLEVIETLNDHHIETVHPVEVVSWTNEEGVRFAPMMHASGVFGGAIDLEYGLSRVDENGLLFSDELKRIGYDGLEAVGQHPLHAALEVHIEQGPLLEAEEKQIGIVTGVQGMRWYNIILTGKESHAGTTPMELRRDPVKMAVDILAQAYALAEEFMPDIRLTFGSITPEPNAVNTIPGKLTITVDLRHPSMDALDHIEAELGKMVAAYDGVLEKLLDSPPVVFDDLCVTAVTQATAMTQTSSRKMISGAGHDAVNVSRVAPTSMIFIPCKDGLSHNELEDVKPEDAVAGTNVLLQAVLLLANEM